MSYVDDFADEGPVIPEVVVTPGRPRMIPVQPGAIGRGVLPSVAEPPEIGAGLSSPIVPGQTGLLEAAFGTENTIVSAFNWMSQPTFEPDPDFNPWPMIEGTKYEESYLDRFVGVQSEDEAKWLMAKIDREEAQRETVARSGWQGYLAAVAAGILDPTILIPVGGWATAATRGGRALVRAGEGAALVGGTVALQEGVLHATQETRTTTESIFAIGSAIFLGGALGGAVGYIGGRGSQEFDELSRRLIDIPGSAAEQQAAWARAVDLGAASTASARGTGELKGALGSERVVNFQDPLIRLQTSSIEAARNAVRDLAETPLTLAENADGIATTIGGAVETRVKMARGPLAQGLREMDDAYSQYFFGTSTRLAPALGTLATMFGRGGGKMSYARFKEAVWDALLNGDVHPIPEVEAAARSLRARVFDPLKQEAINVRLFEEGVKPLDDVGYVPRVYDVDVIRARRTDFVNILARHFEARQNELLERIEDLEARTGADAATLPNMTKRDPLSAQEIRSLAEETTDTILGNSPARVLTPKDLVAGPRGPLKERILRIPTALIRDFVERDPEVLARRYSDTMAADIGLVKRFGSTDMGDQIAKINDETNAKIAEAASEKAKKKLDDARRAAIRDLTAIRDRVRGNYAIPINPDGMLVRAGRVARNLNYMRLLGGMTLSAVPDLARPVTVYGLTRVMGAAFHPFVRGLRTFKLAGKEAVLAGTANDMVLDSRVMGIADVMDDYGRGSKFERAVQAGTRSFGLVSLMAPWNAAIKQFVGIVAQTKMLQLVERVASGKASRKEIEYLASAGIDANAADRIAKQFGAHGERNGAVWWANTEGWTDRQAVEAIRAALVRDIDRVIITPGQDKPLWMSTEMGKLIGQFRSFNIASMQRTVIAGLQQRDAAALNGAMLMLALGGVSYWLKATTAGYAVSDDPVKWATEAFDRSGLAGWLMDANNIVEKLTRGHIGMSYFTGEQASRYASRNALGALLGPTFDQVGDAIQISGSAFSGEWTAADTHALRKLVPIQNVFWLRQAFDAVENSVNQAFGVPMKAERRRAR